MKDFLIIFFTTWGALSMLFAAVGILRMPDFFLRLSVTVKASTLGAGFLLIASAFLFTEMYVTTKILAIILFLFLTNPVAAHMIGRTSYLTGVSLWKGTTIDELEEMYDEKHQLKGELENNENEKSR